MSSSISCSNKSIERKIRKPKIEKLRRARINSSLEQLKEILLRNTILIPRGARPTKIGLKTVISKCFLELNLVFQFINRQRKPIC